jgi:hypothetical protein
MVRMRGVTTMGAGWASGEASDLVEPPLNLVLYMHLRILCARDKADLFHLPALALYRITNGSPEGCVLVLGC